MKVLIVDDEKHVIEAIRLLIDWDRYGINEIFEARDGEQAVDIIKKQKPNIIFTDMNMPNMAGIQLLEWINANKIRSKIIVISGYSDFEYARQTMKYGGLDYILKPIDPLQLEQAIEMAIKSIEVDNLNRKKNFKVNEITPVYWQKLFSDIIQNHKDYSTHLKEIGEHFSLAGIKDCKIVVINVLDLKGRVKEQFQRDKDLLYFSIINICNEIIEKNSKGYAFRYLNKSNEIVLLFWDNIDSVERTVEEIYYNLFSLIGKYFLIGIGQKQSYPENLYISYNAAKEAIEYRSLANINNCIYNYEDIQYHKNRIHFLGYESDLVFAIKSSNTSIINQIIERLYKEIKVIDKITFKEMVDFVEEYKIIRTKWIADLFDNYIEYDEFNVKDILYSGDLNVVNKIIARLKEDIENISSLYANNKLPKEKKVYEVKEYIEHNYFKDISLSDLSSKFFMSREYISRTFKNEFDLTLSEYILTLRMKKALDLIKSDNLKIKEVASLVGYEDVKYFSKVFKKYYGLTPNKIR